MTKARNVLSGALGEGALILAVGTVAFAVRMPLLFPTLGPTAYELVEKPLSPSARTYNILMGHFFALGAGFLSLWILSAWGAPKVDSAGFVTSPRLWAAVLSVVLTTAGTLILNASQPASLATTLLISLGSMQTKRDAIAIAVAVVILAAIGEPVRRRFAQAKLTTTGRAETGDSI